MGRKTVQQIWKRIEKWIVPKLKEMITVNDSIAKLFKEEYGLQVHVIRNIPPLYVPEKTLTKEDLQLPKDKKILILQGAGINVDRGAEELVEAMAFLPDCYLIIIGGGDVLNTLHETAERLQLQQSVRFLPRMPYSEMMQYTQLADLGLTLDKDTNLNYRFSLPNKLFDYLHAGIPVIASNLPEIKNIIDTYEIGTFIVNHKPETIAQNIRETLANTLQMEKWKARCKKVATELCWENEEIKLLKIYAHYF
jgi:glycosyltransferase involved in cell wall biosynthesis